MRSAVALYALAVAVFVAAAWTEYGVANALAVLGTGCAIAALVAAVRDDWWPR